MFDSSDSVCVCAYAFGCCNRPSSSSRVLWQADYALGIDQDTVVDAVVHVADTARFHPVHMNHSRTRPNVVSVSCVLRRH